MKLECFEPFARKDIAPEGEKVFREEAGEEIERGQKRIGLNRFFTVAYPLDHNYQQHCTKRYGCIDPVRTHEKIQCADGTGNKNRSGN